MRIARDLYERAGWEVVDKSSAKPLDLLGNKGAVKRFIEVKATTGAGLSIILTHGEVEHVRKNCSESHLSLPRA